MSRESTPGRSMFALRWLAVPAAILIAGCAPSTEVGDGTGGSGPLPGSGGSGQVSGGTGGSGTGSGGSTGAGTGGSSATTGSGGIAGPTTGSGGDAGSGGTGSGTGGDPQTTGTGGSGGMAGRAGTGGRTGAGGTTGGAGTTGSGSGGLTGEGGAQAGTGGSATVTFSRPAGKIPNSPQPASMTNLSKSDWQKGLLSPSMQVGHQVNQPAVVNGYLVIGGNEEFWIYDVSNPASPKQLSSFTTPGRTGAEAESHTISFARYGNSFYLVTIGGKGVDTWDVTNPSAPKHLAAVKIPGTNYGDYTESVWGVSWQGQYIFVGATNNGIKVLDAADPAAPKIVAEVPTSQYGGVSAGPLEAVGNVLVVMTPKENGGIATLDISDPTKPTKLASTTATKAYIGMFHRHYVFMIGVQAWDVLSNPKSLGSAIGKISTGGAEYMSFQDDTMFLGMVREEIGGTPGATKIDVRDPRSMKVIGNVWGRQDRNGKNDDQFTLGIGNLLVLGDDQSPFAGWVIAVHQADPDTKAPIVDTVIPSDKSTANSTKSRIGVTFSDNIELATVDAASFIVRPVGGQPLAGKYGVRMSVVNFDPDEDLQPGTTYEVVLAKGGIADLVGNTVTTEWKSTFTTN